ncbi:MAG: hypothetical protein ACK4SX_05060 [Alcanivoracaceae bacterium]
MKKVLILAALSLLASVCALAISIGSYFDLKFIGIFSSRDGGYHSIDLERDVYQGECHNVWRLVAGLGDSYAQFSNGLAVAVDSAGQSIFLLIVLSSLLILFSSVLISISKKLNFFGE